MDFKTFSAWLVYCIDTDQMNFPVEKTWAAFQDCAVGIKNNYTDPNDPLSFCRNLVNVHPVEVFTDYILFYFPKNILEAFSKYGNIGRNIINHFKKQ